MRVRLLILGAMLAIALTMATQTAIGTAGGAPRDFGDRLELSMLGWLAPPAGAVPPLQTVSGTWSWVVAESNTQAAEPAAITVATNSDKVDADTSSLEALRSNPGPDGISLREAIEVTNNDPGSYAIAFSAALSGTTITLGEYLPPLTGGGVSIEGDIDGDGTPDVTLVTTLQEQWSRAIQIASSGNRLHGLTLKGFAVGVWIEPITGEEDELPTHQTLADNVISGLAILGRSMVSGIMIHSPASPDCGYGKPDPCRTYITFANTTITGNTIEGSIGFQISNSGDRIEGATVTDNTIRVGGSGQNSGIVFEQLNNAGDDGTPAPISDVLIARNSIEGSGRGYVLGIGVAAGVARAQGNITEAVRVLDNRIHLVRQGSGPGGVGISVVAGTEASPGIWPDVHPLRYPDGNVLRNVEVAGNRLSGDLVEGVWVSAGSASAAGSHNRVLDVQIERNVISSTMVGAGVLLQVGGTEGPAPNLHRWATGNQITGVEIGANRISTGRTRSGLSLDFAGGIVLVGGSAFSRDGVIRDVRIAKNEIKVKFAAVHGGIKLIGGIGPTARRNRVTRVRLVANHVSGTRPAVSVRSNIGATTNYASLGGS